MPRMGLIVGLLVWLPGCSATSPEPEGEIAVSISRTISESTPSFNVRVVAEYTVENVGDTPVFYRPCLTIVDRQVGENWQGRWGRSCTLGPEPVIQIEPHGMRRDSMVVEYNPSPYHPENYSGPVAGTYSIRVLVEDERGTPLSVLQSRSLPFALSNSR